jgi:hypothetical protein
VTLLYDSAGYETFGDQWESDARELGDAWNLNEALTFRAGVPDTVEAVAAGEEALALARTLAPSRVAFAAVLLAANVAEEDLPRAQALLQEAAAAAIPAGNGWVDQVTSLSLLRLHLRTWNVMAAADTALVAFENTLGQRLPGYAIQFVGFLAVVLANLGLVEGALVTAAWAQQHGVVVTRDNAFFWSGGDGLFDIRESQPAAELEKSARVASELDESGLAKFAREQLSMLPSPQT